MAEKSKPANKVPAGLQLRPETLETLRDLAYRDRTSMNEIVEELLLAHFATVGKIPKRPSALTPGRKTG